MHRLLCTLVALAWALWFGGILMVFVAVQSLFDTFADRRDLAGVAASAIFHRFEIFQLALAAAALLATFAWRLLSGASRLKTILFVLFALATVGAVVSTGVITPRIESLRRQGQGQTEAFKRLHGTSMIVYVAEAAILLAAGLVLPAAIAGQTRRASRVAGPAPVAPTELSAAARPEDAPGPVPH